MEALTAAQITVPASMESGSAFALNVSALLESLGSARPLDLLVQVEVLASALLAVPMAVEAITGLVADVVTQMENGLGFLVDVEVPVQIENLRTVTLGITAQIEDLGATGLIEPFYYEMPFQTVDGRRVVSRLDLVLDVPQDVYVVGPLEPFVFVSSTDVESVSGTLMPQSQVIWSGTGVASPGGFPEADVAKVWVQLTPDGTRWRFTPHHLGSGVAIATNEGIVGLLPYTVWPRSRFPLVFTQDSLDTVVEC
jgi:hypothetical protein